MTPLPGHLEVKHFDADWYSWQNPDWRIAHPDALTHYLEVGRFQNRDPSPFIDMRRYGDMVGAAIPPERRLEAIREGLRRPALGVYDSWEDLDAAQRRFQDAITVVRARDERREPRSFLVWLQAGPQSRHRAWFDPSTPRSWDLLINYYDARGYDPEMGDVVFFQAGTKFTAVSKLLRRDPALLAQYDYVLLLDDDIGVSMADLDTLFAICVSHGLDLAQMALSDRSACIWDCLFSHGRKGMRRLNCVEIMMPVLSRRALLACGADFSRSVSGFGLDLMLGKKLAKPDYSNIAVIDDLIADHDKPIDDAQGAYYAYLRSHLINPKAELWRLVKENALEPCIREAA